MKTCEFCKNPLTFSHLENVKEIQVYECQKCAVPVFYYFMVEALTKMMFMIDKQNHLYSWVNDYINNITTIKKVDVKEFDVSKCTIVKTSKVILVTPQNVTQKLKTYLMFL